MKISTKSLVTTGMFTAVLGVLSALTIPLPTGVPVTLQTFGMALCGYVLGWKLGTLAVLLYLLLGTIGIPVFAGMGAGPGVLFGNLGGFLWGFLFLTFFCGQGKQCKRKTSKILLGVAGLLLCHVCGAWQYGAVSGLSFRAAVAAASLPYLWKDLIFVAGACAAASAVNASLQC